MFLQFMCRMVRSIVWLKFSSQSMSKYFNYSSMKLIKFKLRRWFYLTKPSIYLFSYSSQQLLNNSSWLFQYFNILTRQKKIKKMYNINYVHVVLIGPTILSILAFLKFFFKLFPVNLQTPMSRRQLHHKQW